MEPIIRAAPVSSLTRQLYRGAGRHAASVVAGPLAAAAIAASVPADAGAGGPPEGASSAAGGGAAPATSSTAASTAAAAMGRAAPQYGAAKPAPVSALISAPLQVPTAVMAAAQPAREMAAPAPGPLSAAEIEAAQIAAQQAVREAERRQAALLIEKQAEKQADLARQDAVRAQETERLARQAALEAEALADAGRRGYAQGQEQAAAEHRAQTERLVAALAGVAQSRDRLVEQAEDMLVEIAFAAVCRMVGDTVVSRSAMAAMVNGLAREARADDQLCVRLHPQDAALLRQAGGADAAAIDARIVLQGDATVKLGGYLLDSARGVLDARLDVQLLQLRERLLQVRQARQDGAATSAQAAP